MEIRSLVDIELKDALGPVNRAAGGRTEPGMLPLVHTAAQLRERAALGVLDLKLSQALVLPGGIAGACLVERVGERAHLDAFGVDPLALQRGGGRALCEAVVAAAGAAGVRRLTALSSDFDVQLLPILQLVGFERVREVARYTLSLRGPAQDLVPEDLGDAAYDPAGEKTAVRLVPLAEALAVLEPALPLAPPFLQLPERLRRLFPKLTAAVLHTPTGVMAAAVADRERRQLLALHGHSERAAAQLGALLAARYGISFLDALELDDPAMAALEAAGFQRASLRAEFQRIL
jgi:N-acetylglutamate synthase-like GNAT family acetyltransferase